MLPTFEPSARPEGVIWGLQRRLMLLLLLPLGLVGLVSFWLHYQSAGTAALQQDQQLLRLVPLLADSVVVTHSADATPQPLTPGDAPGLALLLAPPVDEFLKDREGFAAYAIREASGRHVLGDAWLPTVLPSTEGAEYLSVVEGGITYRVVAQRYDIAAGDLIVMLADGSDARQHWLDTLLVRVLLPNLLLLVVAAVAVTRARERHMGIEVMV